MNQAQFDLFPFKNLHHNSGLLGLLSYGKLTAAIRRIDQQRRLGVEFPVSRERREYAARKNG